MDNTIYTMRTTRTAEYPPILTINFSVNPDILNQVRALRRSYRSPATIPPNQQPDTTALTHFLTRIMNMSEIEWLRSINNAPLDDDDIHTRWRDMVYAGFENVFAATHAYLLHTEGRSVTGGFSSPCHKVLPIAFPDRTGAASLDRVLNTNVLLLPVWSGAHVSVRVVVGDGANGDRVAEGEVGSDGVVADLDARFDEGSSEICWVKGGSRVRFYIDGTGEGLAAVMVVGTLS